MSERARNLTAKQRAFANLVVSGKEQGVAYREAYDCPLSSPTTVNKEASRTAALSHVAAYIAELISKEEKSRFLSRERKRELLAEFAENKRAKPSERVKAIEVDNVMTGDNAPQQVNVFGLSDILNIVRKGNRG